MPGFFQTYFIDPIYYGTGYNIVNTAVFAAILIVAALLTYKLLRALKIRIDKNFFFGIIPFIALGGILRSWEDLLESAGATSLLNSLLGNFVLVDATGTARNLLLVSPLIYVTMFFVALIPLLIAKLAEKYWKIAYWKSWFTIGIILDAIVLSQLRFINTFGFVAMVGITIFWVVAIMAVKKISIWKSTKLTEDKNPAFASSKIKANSDKSRISHSHYLKLRNFFSNENVFILDVHMFDATTTFVSLSYFSYFEQHVLPSFLIGIFGPGIMFILKFVVVSIVLYFFDKELSKEEDLEKRTFLKIVVLILGMGPGLRNFLRLAMGV